MNNQVALTTYNSSFFRVSFFSLIMASCIFMQFNLTFRGAITWQIFIASVSLNHLRIYCRNLKFPFYILPYFWMISSLSFISLFSSFFIVYYKVNLPYMFERYPWQVHFPNAILLSSIAFSCISFGTSLSHFHRNNPHRHQYTISPYRSASALLFALLLYAYWASTQGGLTQVLTTRTGLQLNGVQRNVGYLVDSPIIGVSVFVCFYIYAEIRHFKILLRFFLICCITLMLIPYVLAGSRSIFIYVYLVCFIAKIIISCTEKGHVPKVRIRTIVIVLILLPAIMVAPRIYRTDNSVNVNSIKKAYSIEEIAQTVIGGDALMIPTLSILIPEVGNKVPRLYGSSYRNLITKPIPRMLWKNKPIEFDMILNNALFPETSRFYGVSFSAISEPLVNFGVIGVAVFFTLLGFLYHFLVARRFELNLQSIVIASWLTGFCFILIRGNLTTDYHRLVFPLCIALFIMKKEVSKVEPGKNANPY